MRIAYLIFAHHQPQHLGALIERLDDSNARFFVHLNQRSDIVPFRNFTRIYMHFVVKGRGLAPEKVERAIALSVEKYCSASAMIPRPRSPMTLRSSIPGQQRGECAEGSETQRLLG